MNSFKAASVLYFFAIAPGLSEIPQEPVVQLLFNKNSNVQESSGAVPVQGFVQSPATTTGLGVSSIEGSAVDLCFDNTASQGMGDIDPSTGTGILFFGNVQEVDGLSGLTVTLWYRTDQGSSLNDGGGRLIENGRDWLLFSDDPDRLRLEVNLEGESSGIGNFPETEEWVFLAVTFDDATDTAQYFKGTRTALTQLIVTRISYTSSMPSRSNPLLIGNNEVLSRSFDGYIDNVRIWDVALSGNQIELVRLSDLNGVGSVTPTVMSEFSDSGALPAEAINSPYDSVLEHVRGDFSSVFDADAFRISIASPDAFEATIEPRDDSFNETGQLFLFNQFGHLIAGQSAGPNGVVSLSGAGQNWLPGLYYLMATPDGLIPESANGPQASIDFTTGVVTLLPEAVEAVSNWGLGSFNGTAFSYTIDISGAYNSTRDFPIDFAEGLQRFDGFTAFGTRVEIGKSYSVWTSENLVSWQSEVTAVAVDEETLWVLPTLEVPRKFFRLEENTN